MEIRNEVNELLRRFDRTDEVEALNIALELIESTELDSSTPKMGGPGSRTEKVRLFLSLLNHIDAKVVPGFDFKNPPSISTAPPDEVQLPAGVDPEAIKDPRLRAQYEKEIAANQHKLKIYSYQMDLQEKDRACVELLETYISEHYSRSSEKALHALIDETITSKARASQLKGRASALLAHLR